MTETKQEKSNSGTPFVFLRLWVSLGFLLDPGTGLVSPSLYFVSQNPFPGPGKQL